MIRVDTRQYEITHGKKPRGWGYWGFEINGEPSFWERGTFTEAKKRAYQRAKEYFKGQPITSMILLP